MPQSLKSIWHLAWSPDGSTLYAGVDPAGLFASDDRGASWRDVPALNEHATRSAWEPSRGLFALHSICVDRAGSAATSSWRCRRAACTRSVDAGASWSPANDGVRAENRPERFPVAGHNVHRVVMHPLDGQRLYRQCYNGTYRSDDGGRTWVEITGGLPSDFGYAIACDPFDPDTVFQIPESSSHLRATVDGRLRVFRSTDAGRSWASASAGLPQQHAYVTVLRDAMDADARAAGPASLRHVVGPRFHDARPRGSMGTRRGVPAARCERPLRAGGRLTHERPATRCSTCSTRARASSARSAPAARRACSSTSPPPIRRGSRSPRPSSRPISRKTSASPSRSKTTSGCLQRVARLDPALSVAYACPGDKPGRRAGASAATVERIHREGGFAATYVKADGARMRLVKAPADDEPALPGVLHDRRADPFRARDRRAADRARRASGRARRARRRPAGERDRSRPRHLGRLLASPDGLMKSTEGRRVVPVINMVDDALREAAGARGRGRCAWRSAIGSTGSCSSASSGAAIRWWVSCGAKDGARARRAGGLQSQP